MRLNRTSRNHHAIAVDLARLPGMTLPELRALWDEHIGGTVPLQRNLLIRELAWRAQEQRHGGLDARTRNLLEAAMRAAGGAADGQPPALALEKSGRFKRRHRPRQTPALPAAVRLVREWGGQRHEVTVVENGRAYRYRDRTYASLSEVAREITGAHWSGPRFFGLAKRSKGKNARLKAPSRGEEP